MIDNEPPHKNQTKSARWSKYLSEATSLMYGAQKALHNGWTVLHGYVGRRNLVAGGCVAVAFIAGYRYRASKHVDLPCPNCAAQLDTKQAVRLICGSIDNVNTSIQNMNHAMTQNLELRRLTEELEMTKYGITSSGLSSLQRKKVENQGYEPPSTQYEPPSPRYKPTTGYKGSSYRRSSCPPVQVAGGKPASPDDLYILNLNQATQVDSSQQKGLLGSKC